MTQLDIDPVVLTRRGTLALAMGAACATAVRAAPTSKWAAVDAAARQLIADRLVPGLSLSVMRAGKIVHAAGFGFANLETGTPVAPDTVFRIGSITKQFTGAAIVLLAQDGKLSVGDPLSRFFPEFPRANEITLRQMLNHTSGLGNYTNRKPPEAFLMSARVDYDAKALLADMIAHTDPLYAHEPGTTWDYSNTAYVLLGLVIEKVTGAPYADFFKTRLFGPAGLTQTAVDDAAALVRHRASGYTGHPGSPTEFDNAPYISMTYPGAAGSIRSTAGDLCRWHDALLGGRIMSADGLKQMTTPGRLNDGTLPVVAPMPNAPKAPISYGLGVFTDAFEGHAAVRHSGGIFGFISDLRSFPDDRVTIAILVNADGGGRTDAGKRFQAFKDTVARAALVV